MIWSARVSPRIKLFVWRTIYALAFWNGKGGLEEALTICWLIWSSRNSCFHSGVCQTPAGLLSSAVWITEEFSQVAVTSGRVLELRSGGWQPPPEGVFKINVDAAHSSHSFEAKLGVVIRNHCAQALQLDSIQVESDSLLAVNELRKKDSSMSEWFGIIKDVIDVSGQFSQCVFLHTKRAGNALADSVAKCSAAVIDSIMWRKSLPPDVLNLDVIAP
ncbi:hypothetical protein PTKIN_Ptkin15bG0151000 [Pterospermum kingtungense]